MPDSVETLHKLGMVKTPAQDYDDSYCIQYARTNNAFIVTNDKYRDYLQKVQVTPSMNSADQVKRERAWIK